MKVDREAVAGLVLPQLWTMSMGPRKPLVRLFASRQLISAPVVLNVDQFSKFMTYVPTLASTRTLLMEVLLCSVIKSLGARVEREHIDHLRSVQHAEAQTASLGMQNSGWELGNGVHESSEVDFETLVGRSSGAGTPHGVGGSVAAGSPSILDDSWGNDMAWLQPKRPDHPVSHRKQRATMPY